MIRRILKAFALLVVVFAVAIPMAATTFKHSERSVIIGAHNTTVQPRFDGYATLDFGPVLPRMRIPVTNSPFGIGAYIDFGDSEVTDLDQLVARDAIIASQPRGEIEKVTSTVVDMGRDAALRGLGMGLLAGLAVAIAWRAVGPHRRKMILEAFRHPSPRHIVVGVGVGVTALVSLALIGLPDRPMAETEATDTQWEELSTALPNIPTDKILSTVQIKQGAASAGGTAIVEGALQTYQKSVDFYGKLTKEANKALVRTPEDGEKTALVVTDRHDNIGMDPVARAIARQAKAKILFDLGDDTSVGGDWEAFSLNSLANEFKGFDVVAVAGNHDHGSFVRESMADHGFNVLKGKPVTIDDIRFIGSSDPRSSGLTAGYNGDETEANAAIHVQDKKLTKAACDDGDVSVALLHSPSSAKKLAASGCVDLVLSGHLHRQVGPKVLTAESGRKTVTLSTGTTGGAVYAFALGSKLRRPAEVTIVTFKDGRPVGLQPVKFGTGGQVKPQPYFPIKPSTPSDILDLPNPGLQTPGLQTPGLQTPGLQTPSDG